MIIKPSTALRNGYAEISALARASGEPIVITNKGEADLIVMSVDAFGEREKMFRHRDKVLEAEITRLSGEPAYSTEDIHEELEELFRASE